MTSPRPTNGSQKIYMWIIGVLWALLFFVFSSAYARINEDVKEATKLTTQNNIRLNSVEENIREIKTSVHTIEKTLNEFLLQRYGYIPKSSTIN